MACLYADDYGPPEPGFDALAQSGRLIQGFEAHAAVLSRATNLGQLEAMERALQRSDDVRWCDQSYSWADGAAVHVLFAAILALVILPYAARRLGARWRIVPAALAGARSPFRLSPPFRK
jgi:hypothetical protein